MVNFFDPDHDPQRDEYDDNVICLVTAGIAFFTVIVMLAWLITGGIDLAIYMIDAYQNGRTGGAF